MHAQVFDCHVLSLGEMEGEICWLGEGDERIGWMDGR